MMRLRILATMCAAGSAVAAASTPVVFEPIDLSPSFNGTVTINADTYPAGPQTLRGVPFTLADDPRGAYGWFAELADGDNPIELEVEVDREGVTAVHALMNTFWGQAQGGLIGVEFIGAEGTVQAFDLIGNDEIRDFNQAEWTNAINGCTTQEVFNNGFGQRLDRVTFELSAALQAEGLQSIVIRDDGMKGFSRVFVVGATLQQGVCPADLDFDFSVGSADLNRLLSEFGSEEVCNGDIDGDGVVGSADLNLLLADFGRACGP